MKKLLMALMSLAMVMMLTACGNDAPKKVVIGLDDNFAPMGFRNEKNEIVGFDIDLAREACKRLKMEVEFKPIDWGAKEARIKPKGILKMMVKRNTWAVTWQPANIWGIILII